MKIVSLFVLCSLFFYRGFSQKISTSTTKLEAIDSAGDVRQFNGYTVKMRLPEKGGYNFEIARTSKNASHEFLNPLPFARKGIKTKADAYKIAQWIIAQHQKTNHWENTIPPYVARQLGIDLYSQQ